VAVINDDGNKALLISTNKAKFDWYKYKEANSDSEDVQTISLDRYEVRLVITWQSAGREIFEVNLDLVNLATREPS
jgi:hypothetical protein